MNKDKSYIQKNSFIKEKFLNFKINLMFEYKIIDNNIIDNITNNIINNYYIYNIN